MRNGSARNPQQDQQESRGFWNHASIDCHLPIHDAIWGRVDHHKYELRIEPLCKVKTL